MDGYLHVGMMWPAIYDMAFSSNDVANRKRTKLFRPNIEMIIRQRLSCEQKTDMNNNLKRRY